MKTTKLLFSLCLAMLAPHAFATGEAEQASKDNAGIAEISASETPKKKSRFTIGGYGEAVYSRNFYSDSYLRYSSPNRYKDETHGRFDLPHVVLMLGYDFGKGWSMGMEIEFEHGGTESAIEIENEEGGEYEAEIERGGEVALEQFWLQKSFCPEFNIKLGHIIVPVGATNAHHLPTEFFGVYRPEGENTIMPCTWHQTGISLWGQAGDWRYEALLVAGLNSELFGRQSWIHDGAASPYEFKIANSMAGAFRVDNYSIKGLRLSLSGYVGNSFRNTLKVPVSDSYDGVNGTVLIGAFDFLFDRWNWIARGNFDYGYLSDSDIISAYNKDYSDNTNFCDVNVFCYKEIENNKLEGFVVYPSNFDKKEKYPVVLLIHGGPKIIYSNQLYFEAQLLASNGYFVIYCNPRGSDGKGDIFSNISGKFGVLDYIDIMDFVN